MKTKMKSVLSVATLLLAAQTASAQSGLPITQTNQGGVAQSGQNQGGQNQGGGLVGTDQGGVRNAGQGQNAFGTRVSLANGMYYIADMSNRKESYGLLVEQDVNNPGYVLAIMVPLETINGNGRPGRGYFLQGRSILNGTKVMFSPIALDNEGNLRIVSEMRTDAPVLELTQLPGRANKYPYVMTGHNGMMGGAILGMRGADSGRPSLNRNPSEGFFLATTSDKSGIQALVLGTTVTLKESGSTNSSFQLWELNGMGGKFSALLDSRLNTMGEFMVTREAIKKVVTFMRQPGKDMMIVASPAWGEGEFQFSVYKLAEKSLIERWFPGRTSPRGSGN